MNGKEYTKVLDLDFGPDGKTLIPVVTQDYESKEILIVSFVNKEAFAATRESGFACYWSRSRNELWRKGESSGNRLLLKEIRVNCEQNSLVFLVTQEGAGACHSIKKDGTAHRTCYYRRVNQDNSLTNLDE